MKGCSILLLAGIAILAGGCMDLDVFITPTVFNPTKTQSYQLGAYEDGELSQEVNALFPDTDLGGHFEEHQFASDGETIFALYLHHSGTPATTILYCHGNTHSMDNYWFRAKLLYQTGYDVFLFDYRGFGKSTGEISESGMLQDSRQALNYLVNNLGVGRTQILLYGFSIGTVPATDLAANSNMETSIGLVLEAPVGSTELYVQDSTYLSIPVGFLTKYDLNNIFNIKKVIIPFLWVHGDQDRMNRLETHGQAVYDACNAAEKHSKIVGGAAHSDIPLILGDDFSTYIAGIRNFIEKTYPPFN